jgi:1-phosphofructokinase family hexose kinase
MRIVTLTLHPAIDRIVRVQSLTPGDTFDGKCEIRVPSGKGVNTARSLRCILPGAPIIAAAWVGENEAPWFARELMAISRVRAALCLRRCTTRAATTILERNGRETHVKEAMDPPAASERSAFLAFWKKILRRGDIVAVCGSAPAGTPPDFLRKVFAIAQRRCAAVIADTNGAALEAAGSSAIAGIKGNAAEIGAWLRLRSPLDIANSKHRAALRSAFGRSGAPKSMLVTLGPSGALYATRDEILTAAPPRVRRSFIISATGCGDAATAGWLWGLLEGCAADEILRRAVACGTAKLASADPGAIDARQVRTLLTQVKITLAECKFARGSKRHTSSKI